MNSFARIFVGLSSTLLLGSCAYLAPGLTDPKKHNVIDAPVERTREDYRNLLEPNKDTEFGSYKATVSGGASGEPPIPDVAQIITAPRPPELGETKLVSIAVTDDVPLKDVLLELARLADVDIEVDAGISGGISFRAKERPFNEVIARVADLAGLRYSMKNNVLRVERDSPYVEIYTIDFLNVDRSTESSVNISTNVLSSSGGGSSSDSSSSGSSSSSSSSGSSGGGGLNTGSTSTITSKSESDFWQQFEEGIKQILAYRPVNRMSLASISQQTPATTTPGAPAAAAPQPSAPASGSTTSGSADAASTSSTLATDSSGATVPFYIINRQAATLTVSASERQHRMIREFIKRMQSNASAQVLIEAKIVEVTLNEEFQSGINWNQIGGSKINFNRAFTTGTTTGNVATFTFGANDLTGLNIDIDGAVKLAENFGTTRTLSSPRLHAINNQQAVLTFAENQVYFQLTVERQEQTSGTTTLAPLLTVNSEIKTVPIGIILTMMPSINLETDEVTLSVRPTLSRVTGSVSDPAVAFIIAQAGSAAPDIENNVPVVEVRELDSILKLKSGQVMVIGGLMEDRSINNDDSLPGVSHVPIVGNLFKSIERNTQTKELVIFIRATIVDSQGNSQPADRSVYDRFTRDPRPLTF